jgi:hypothetical protein
VGRPREPEEGAARASEGGAKLVEKVLRSLGVSFDDWMLALHVLSAFAFVAGLVAFWTLTIAGWRTDTPEGTLRMGPVSRVAGGAIGIGAGGTIILGIWLAFSVGGYDIWDPWIVAAIVLWVIVARLGQRTNAAYAEGVNKAKELQAAGQTGPNAELLALNRTPTGLRLQLLVSIVVLLILIDMIWKPGA